MQHPNCQQPSYAASAVVDAQPARLSGSSARSRYQSQWTTAGPPAQPATTANWTIDTSDEAE